MGVPRAATRQEQPIRRQPASSLRQEPGWPAWPPPSFLPAPRHSHVSTLSPLSASPVSSDNLQDSSLPGPNLKPPTCAITLGDERCTIGIAIAGRCKRWWEASAARIACRAESTQGKHGTFDCAIVPLFPKTDRNWGIALSNPSVSSSIAEQSRLFSQNRRNF